MTSLRPILALAALLATAGPAVSTATAAPAKTCKLVVDDKGDDYVVRSAPSRGAADQALDIVSADVASNATTVTAVVRVAKLVVPAASSPTGALYELQFRVSGSGDLFYLNAAVSPAPAGVTYDVGYRTTLPAVTTIATSLGTATGAVDLQRSEVRISAPLSVFASRGGIKKGGKISITEALVGRGARGRGLFADDAPGGKSYVAGNPSCVTVGK